ncbi:hypothetical protein BH10ACT6_BH10ACT6_07830 [soil metagenome]
MPELTDVRLSRADWEKQTSLGLRYQLALDAEATGRLNKFLGR